MRFSCLLCQCEYFEEAAPFLCTSCFARLELARPHSEITSLFRYNEASRKLILLVKIEGNYRALSCLCHLFLNSAQVGELSQRNQVIVPAPSSLWSRMRGRFDLAWLLSAALARQTQCKLQRAPLHLYWQTKKRSKLGEREGVEIPSRCEGKLPDTNTLIVDDVVSSGHTLRRTALALKNTRPNYLTLASALAD